jgi:PhoPQ-activated pathogenicity-related protein
MAPIVMDLLNLAKNLQHHYQSLGGWTNQFEDYYVNNITLFFDSPQIQKLADIVDPYCKPLNLQEPK